MDRQDIDMTYRAPNIIGALILNIWTVASLTVYGAICAVIGLFSRMGAQFFCKNWMVMFLGLAGVRIEIKGRSKLDTKECYIFLCNHQSLLDIPVLYTCLHNPL
ncbi:MAG: 1-acyl-sn-glycerol-3-phosphate acyltransferase, partial [Chitinispirillaceae bacterium]|nr:1-acyl-sn-glycerol-3-phosphate acyltransferase [Chitinispirillaceae bacterium]